MAMGDQDYKSGMLHSYLTSEVPTAVRVYLPHEADAEIKQLRARIKEFENRLALMTYDRDRLASENAGLREDKARIDWQEANGSRGVYRMHSGTWFRPGFGEYHYSSFREALDAARGAK